MSAISLHIESPSYIYTSFCAKNTHFVQKHTGPDSLLVRASASGAVERGLVPRSRHTKGVKNGTSSSLADARIKRVVLGDNVR